MIHLYFIPFSIYRTVIALTPALEGKNLSKQALGFVGEKIAGAMHNVTHSLGSPTHAGSGSNLSGLLGDPVTFRKTHWVVLEAWEGRYSLPTVKSSLDCLDESLSLCKKLRDKSVALLSLSV
jgi:hypothetical protein